MTFNYLSSMLVSVAGNFRARNLKGDLLRGGVGVVAMRGGGLVLNFVITVLMARFLGPEQFGLYSFTLAFAALLVMPAQFGLPALLMRETAKSLSSKHWEYMKGIWLWTDKMVFASSAALVILAVLVWPFIKSNITNLPLEAYLLGLTFVPLTAVLNLRCAALRGLGRVVLALAPEFLLQRALFVVATLSFVFATGFLLEAVAALALYMLALIVACGVSILMLYHVRPRVLKQNVSTPKFEYGAWFKAILPLAFIAGMNAVMSEVDKVMLGFFVTTAEVGLYTATARGATLVAFGLLAINLATQPYLVRFYTEGDRSRLQRLAAVSAGFGTSLALPVFFLFSAFGPSILALLFGAAYAEAHLPLIILSIGQLVMAFVGAAGWLLVAAGHENDMARILFIAAICNVLLNLMLIPLFGIIGASVATAVAQLFWQIALWLMVRRRLGIESTLFGLFIKNRM